MLTLLVRGRQLLRGTPFNDWQAGVFDTVPVASAILLFLLSLLVLLAGHRNPGPLGLAIDGLRYHGRGGLLLADATGFASSRAIRWMRNLVVREPWP